MGTWGPGNFQSDAALEEVLRITERLEKAVTAGLIGRRKVTLSDAESFVMARIGILLALAESDVDYVPEKELVARWENAYLALWDKHHRSFGGSAVYNRDRRAVIVNTFAALARAAR